MKLLVFDDEPLILESLREYLQTSGNEVIIASNGKIGWEIFVQDPFSFDVLLVDAKMPIMGGMDVLKKIRAEDFHVPVVLMTGHGDVEIPEEALKLGAFDVILKPFELSVLESLLSKATFFLETP